MPARYHLLTLLLVLPAPAAGAGGAASWRWCRGSGSAAATSRCSSCLTTTGATLFDRPQLIAEPLHLWRALVGWMGGLMVLVTAFAILAPLNLGGFEIGQRRAPAAREAAAAARIEEANRRILRALAPDRADLCRPDRGAGAGAAPRRRPAVRRGLPRHGDALDQRHLAGRRHRRRPVRAARRDRDRALPAAGGLAPRLQPRGPPPAPGRGSPTRRSSSC